MRNSITYILGGVIFLLSSAAYSEENILKWVGCGISKKSYMTKLAAEYTKSKGTKIDLQGGGATRGIRDVANKTADIGGSCRFHLPGDELEAKTVFEPLAWDALALIVHPNNPVNNLSLAQVKSIYSGKINNWSELGGNDTPIKLFSRKGKISGVGYSIRSIIFHDTEMDFPFHTEFKSSGPLEKGVEADANAIAITGVSSARLRNVKILSLNNKQPDYDSIRSGNYVLYRPLYLTFNSENPKIAQIKDLIKYAHSRKGRKIMKKNGVVPYMEALRLVMIQSRESLSSQKKSDSDITY